MRTSSARESMGPIFRTGGRLEHIEPLNHTPQPQLYGPRAIRDLLRPLPMIRPMRLTDMNGKSRSKTTSSQHPPATIEPRTLIRQKRFTILLASA
jgi:hypothetical protein